MNIRFLNTIRFPQLLLTGVLLFSLNSCNKDSIEEVEPEVFSPSPTNLLRIYKDSLLNEEYYYYQDWLINKYTYESDGNIYESKSYHYDDKKLLDYSIEYNSYLNRTDTNNFKCYQDGRIFYFENKVKKLDIHVIYNSLNQIKEIKFHDEYNSWHSRTYNYDDRGNIILSNFEHPIGFDIDSFEYDSHKNPLKNFWMSNVYIEPSFISQSNVLRSRLHQERYDPSWDGTGRYSVTITDNELVYDYEYNESGLPTHIIESNLTRGSTTTYDYEYITK